MAETSPTFGQFCEPVTTPAAVNSNATTDTGKDKDAFIANDASSNWVAVWYSTENVGGAGTDEDIFVSRSTDKGVTWTTLAALNSNATTDTGVDKKAVVATDRSGNWVAVWESDENLNATAGVDKDIFVSRSTDNGATWTAVATLNSNATTDTGDDKSPFLTTDGSGNWVAVWESAENLNATAGTDPDIFVSRSTDNGATWTAVATLNSNATTDTGEDTKPRIVTDRAGNWVTVWGSQENFGGAGTDDDIFVSRSSDNGATWTTVALLNSNATTDGAAENDKDAMIATDEDGNWVTVWGSDGTLSTTVGTDSDIFVSRSTDNGATWSTVATLNSDAATDGALEDDKRPFISADGGGNWVVLWESTNDVGTTIGTDEDILMSRSVDAGATWTARAAFNANAATDTGADKRVTTTSDRAGNWVATWYSTDTLGTTIGTDEDILVGRYYTIVDLGTLTGDPSLAFAINSSVQIAAADEDATTDVEAAWLWDKDAETSLGTLGGTSSCPKDINSGGTIVGWSQIADGSHRAFSWTSGGGMTDLGTLSGRPDSEAYGINTNGEIVGAALKFGVPPSRWVTMIYLPSTAYGLPSGLSTLGSLGGPNGIAWAINDSGEVVGGAQNSAGKMRPFLWLPSAAYSLSAGMNDLGTLGGSSRFITHRANDINNSGEVVGASYTAGGNQHAFIWLPSAAHTLSAGINDLSTLTGGDTSIAFGLNASGKVVGTSNVTGGAFHAFVWQNGVIEDVNNLIHSSASWVTLRATEITDNGEIVGWGTNPSSATRGFLLPAACAASLPALAEGPPLTDPECDDCTSRETESTFPSPLAPPICGLGIIQACCISLIVLSLSPIRGHRGMNRKRGCRPDRR